MADALKFDFAPVLIGSVESEVTGLIAGRQSTDPRLYDAILLLNNQLEKISQVMSPLVVKATEVRRASEGLTPPIAFKCESSGVTVRFTWSQVSYAVQYEIRQGTVWDTATFRVRTSGLQANIDPLVYGNYTFLIKSVDAEGTYSSDFSLATIVVPLIAAPQVTVSVIDNNVLLYWTEPVSLFKIDYYLVAKTGGVTGKITGTFTSIFEIVAGVYVYKVSAVDLAGNVGIEALVEAQVNAPPDFALQDSRISALNGTRVNVLKLLIRPSLLCCWPPQTWHEHFRVLRSWWDPEDQVTAGYPIYIQPTIINGSYEEVIDYGLVINNTIITLTWNTVVHTPLYAMNIVVRMASSTDGISYSAFTDGASQYFRQLRYLKFRLEFTAENDKTFIELYNLNIRLNAKKENDGGEVNAVSTDSSGTIVYFNKPFKDIESITCTTKSTVEPYTVIFDFNDIPNPVSFRVFVFDTVGARVTKTVDWKARGIV